MIGRSNLNHKETRRDYATTSIAKWTHRYAACKQLFSFPQKTLPLHIIQTGFLRRQSATVTLGRNNEHNKEQNNGTYPEMHANEWITQ